MSPQARLNQEAGQEELSVKVQQVGHNRKRLNVGSTWWKCTDRYLQMVDLVTTYQPRSGTIPGRPRLPRLRDREESEGLHKLNNH